MKCRNLTKNSIGKPTLVWFGSAGLQTAKFKESGQPGQYDTILPASAFTIINKTFVVKYDFVNPHHSINTMRIYIQMLRQDGSVIDYISYGTYNVVSEPKSTFTKTVTISLTTSALNKIASAASYKLSFTNCYDDFSATVSGNNAIKADEYVDGNQAVASGLNQRLSVIKGELWYNISEGLPLFDKGISITSVDTYVIRTIELHPDVVEILSFSSTLDGTTYHCYTEIQTKYGTLSLTV